MNPSFWRGLLEARRAASSIKRSHSIPQFRAKDQGEDISHLRAGGGTHAPLAREVNIAMGLTAATRVHKDSTAQTPAHPLIARFVLQDSMHPQDPARAPRALVEDTQDTRGLLAAPIARAAEDNT
jgi:hypothetical protein